MRLSDEEKMFRKAARKAFEKALRTGLYGWTARSESESVTITCVTQSACVKVDETTLMTVCFNTGPVTL